MLLGKGRAARAIKLLSIVFCGNNWFKQIRKKKTKFKLQSIQNAGPAVSWSANLWIKALVAIPIKKLLR